MNNFNEKVFWSENGILSKLAGCEFPVYISKELNLLFSPHVGNNQHKAAVTTIPKSGTYLIAELLKHAGFELVKLNVRKNSIRDFRWKDLNDLTNLDKTFPLEYLVHMILPGQVIAGHIEYDNDTKKALSDFKKIFVYRNMRDSLVSAMKHGEKWSVFPSDKKNLQQRDGPEKLLWYMNSTLCKNFITTTNHVVGWLEDKDTFKISYEDLMGDFGIEKRNEVLIQLFQFLDYNIKEDQIENILNLTFSADTLTKTDKRTNIEKFWNDSVENEFARLGFSELNSKLGYDV